MLSHPHYRGEKLKPKICLNSYTVWTKDIVLGEEPSSLP